MHHRRRSIVLTIKFTFTLYWILSVIPNGENHRFQQFTLYSNGQTENYTQSVCDLTLVSPIVQANQLQSVCSQIGVWAFFTGQNFSIVNTYGYHPASTGWTCNSRRIMADWQSPFKSIRHLGNSDLDTPSLSLYSKPFFATTELFLNGHHLSLSGITLEFGSFGFTGRESWTLFSEPNFLGDSVCLHSKADEIGVAIGVTYTAKLMLSASSFRMGCFGRQILLPSGNLEIRTSTDVVQSDIRNNMNLTILTLINSESNNSLDFSGTEVRLPCITYYDGFHISRGSKWTVYSGSAFDGDSVCLVFSPPQMRLRDGSESFNMSLTAVGSIRLGCPQNPSKENTTVIIASVKLSNPQPPLLSLVSDSNASSSTNSPLLNNISGVSGLTSKVTTPTSREGRGRHINVNPVYVPDDRVSKTTTKITTTTTTTMATPTTTTAVPTTTQPILEESITTESESDKDLITERIEEFAENLSHILIEPEVKVKKHGENDHKPNKAPATTEEGGDTMTAGMFFTAFLIILGILVAAMVATIGVFIYLRVTRSAEVDVES